MRRNVPAGSESADRTLVLIQESLSAAGMKRQHAGRADQAIKRSGLGFVYSFMCYRIHTDTWLLRDDGPGVAAAGVELSGRNYSPSFAHESVYNTALEKVRLPELAITVGQIDVHRLSGFRPAATDLGEPELESVRAVYPRAMFGLGDRVENGLAARLDIARDNEPRSAAVNIDFKIDVRDVRLVDIL